MATSDDSMAGDGVIMDHGGEVCWMSPSGNLFMFFLFGRSGNVCFVCLAYFIASRTCHLRKSLLLPAVHSLRFASFSDSSSYIFLTSSPPLLFSSFFPP